MMAHTAVDACHPLIREWRNSRVARSRAGGKQGRGDALGWGCAAAGPGSPGWRGKESKQLCWEKPLGCPSAMQEESLRLMHLQESHPKRAVQPWGGSMCANTPHWRAEMCLSR